MSTTKHTPGPWCIEQASEHGCYILDEATRWTIARVGHTLADVEAGLTGKPSGNARLIAAAPELLEALRLALREMDGFQKYWTSPNMGLKRGKCAAQEAAELALEKAGVK